jgi:hypothetical protein
MAKATPAPKPIATDAKGVATCHPGAVATCHYVLADGRICQSPALRKQLFCYYHSRQRDRSRNIAASARRRQSQSNAQSLPDLDVAVITSLNLPTPDDPVAIQVCIAGILQAMMTGALSGALGGRLLYGLHLAKCNYREVDAFNERHRNTAFAADHADTISVAATDPEPIPPLEDSSGYSTPSGVDSRSEEELDRYAALLEIDELALPDADEDSKDDCRYDDEFRALLGLIDIEQSTKQHLLEDLESKARSFRHVGRRQIIREAKYQLEAIRAASQGASPKAVPGVQPKPMKKVTA